MSACVKKKAEHSHILIFHQTWAFMLLELATCQMFFLDNMKAYGP
jgi:hypothetical protein